MTNNDKIKPHIYPEIEDWPLYKLSEDRRAFVDEIVAYTKNLFLDKYTPQRLNEIISKTIYQERLRIKEDPWKVDPPKDKQFWGKVKVKLIKGSLDKPDDVALANNTEILDDIIRRYAEEIVGTFKKKSWLFARKFLTLFFTRLLIAARAKTLFQLLGSKDRLSDRMIVKGEIDPIRKLVKKGTLVIVPTHFSNLDSIMVGYAIDTFVGLPAFSYGAGLNLYNAGYAAYFMNRLGAYRVDRRKKNMIYLSTLKAMSKLSLERGVHNIFFPGGTRSRSGSIEKKLKLGLLNTVVEAQRSMIQKKKEDRVFVIPLVINYHFVLEAKDMIEQYLMKEGGDRYLSLKDSSNSIRNVLHFAWRSFSQTSDIVLSFGQPMDVLGNPVDENGVSYDKYGNKIDIKEYFVSQGNLKADYQRDSEYTKILANRVIERFHKDSIVLTSHLTAFAAFEILKQKNRNLDIYGVLRLPTDDWEFDRAELIDVVRQLKEVLYKMRDEGSIKLSEQIEWEPEQIILDGIKHLGTFHVQKPIKENKQGKLISENFKLLFYYHNRLEHYKLDRQIVWKKDDSPIAYQ